MNGVAVTLKPSEEAKGEDANQQAHQGQQDAHPRDDVQEHVVHAVRFLQEERERSRAFKKKRHPLTCLHTGVPCDFVLQESHMNQILEK